MLTATLAMSLFLNLIALITGLYLISYKGGISYIKLLLSTYRGTGKLMSTSTAVVGRTQEFLLFDPTPSDIIFLGDSITEGGKWSEMFPGVSARNRGVGGDKTLSILNRLGETTKGSPKKIFISVGINDLIRQYPEGEMLITFEKIISQIKRESKDTRIYMTSILPLNKEMTTTIYERNNKSVVNVTNAKIKEVNEKIRHTCSLLCVTFVDAFSYMESDQGELFGNSTSDGVHLNPIGYKKLSEVLAPYVYE